MEKITSRLRNSIRLQILFFLAIMIILFGLYFLCIDRILDQKTIERSVVRESDMQTVCDISLDVTENGKGVLNGWILRINSMSRKVQVLLVGKDEGETILLDTKQSKDEIVSDYFNPAFDFGDISFETRFSLGQLEKDVLYEVIIAFTYGSFDETTGEMKESTKYVETQRYIWNNELYSYVPNDFIMPCFEDEYMTHVVNNGELCLYDSNETVYVYKYDNNFYWIVGKKFDFNSDGKTYISYHIWTSMIEKLPEHRQIHGFDNRDFYFETSEYLLDETSEYRVAVRSIPVDFPIVYCYTALYDFDEHVVLWRGRIKPSYQITK